MQSSMPRRVSWARFAQVGWQADVTDHATLRDRLVPIYDRLAPFVTLNLLWIVVSVPIVTMIPATAALLYAMNRYVHGSVADWSTYFEGLRRWFWRSYLWGGLNVLVIGLLASNIIFYTRFDSPWATPPAMLAVVLLALWLTLQVLTFPLMLQQEAPWLRLALRNSVVLLARRPGPVVTYTLLIGLIAISTTFVFPFAWLFISASLCAYLMNRATIRSLRVVIIRSPAPEP